jgi:hypothetical protein
MLKRQYDLNMHFVVHSFAEASKSSAKYKSENNFVGPSK